MKNHKTAITLVAPIAVFILDRCLKWLFTHNWSEAVMPLIGDYFSLRLAYNPGVAFGFFLNYWLIIILYLIAFIFLIYYALVFCRRQEYWRLLALALAVVGAVSNFLDRLYFGRVIDYIDVKYFSIFNLADASIVVGLVLLAFLLESPRNK